jgi:hypothetical protein
MACSSGGTEQLVDDPQPDARTVIKGGLDAPAVAVGPFLDGALPPRTPNAPGSGQWASDPPGTALWLLLDLRRGNSTRVR